MLDISDHAVLRYLERVKGLSIEAIKAEMRTPAAEKACAFGAPVVIGRNGEWLVIRDGIIVTVIAEGRHQGRYIRT